MLPNGLQGSVLGCYPGYCLCFWSEANRNAAYTRYEKRASALLENLGEGLRAD